MQHERPQNEELAAGEPPEEILPLPEGAVVTPTFHLSLVDDSGGQHG